MGIIGFALFIAGIISLFFTMGNGVHIVSEKVLSYQLIHSIFAVLAGTSLILSGLFLLCLSFSTSGLLFG